MKIFETIRLILKSRAVGRLGKSYAKRRRFLKEDREEMHRFAAALSFLGKKGLEEELDLYSLIALAGAGSELYIYDPQVIRPSPFSDLCVVNVKDIIRSWLSPDSPLQDNPLAQEFKEEVISASAQWLSEQTQSPLFFFRPQKKMALAEAKLFLEELLNRHFFVEAKPENKHEVNS